VNGATIFTENYPLNTVSEELNFSKFSRGVYFITIQGVSSKRYTKKIIKN
jgi:hypothetical protein